MSRLLALLLHDVYERDFSESGFAGPAADRYKLSVGEFEAQVRGIRGARADRPILVSEQPPAADGAVPFALTVDDGGVSYYGKVADRLEARGWRGHCFVTTGFIGRRGFLAPRHIRELHARGHVIGTHSVTHPSRFGARPWRELLREWSDSRKALQDILGSDVTVGSIPGGHSSPPAVRAADAAGLTVVFTSEPETHIRRVGGCRVIGRFSLRAGCAAHAAARLVRLERAALMRHWLAWHAKKPLKLALGRAYPCFAERVVGLQRDGKTFDRKTRGKQA